MNEISSGKAGLEGARRLDEYASATGDEKHSLPRDEPKRPATWFVTGSSTGLGRAMAEELLKRGFNVAVTARDAALVADLADIHGDRALPVALDVTRQDQVTAAVELAESRFGGVDVLVNNAGYGYRGAVEEGADDEIRALFETNFFGCVNLIQAVLPGMRTRRRGMVVNMSSVAGRVSQPGSGYYSASKFAVEGLSLALREEVAPLGIGVMVVEPSGFRTDFAGRSLAQSRRVIDDYASTSGARRRENDDTHGTQLGDPQRAAAAIIDAVTSQSPPYRLLLGRSAFERVSRDLVLQQEETERWRQKAIDADFPAPGGFES